jgi:hypothetical protein
LSFLIRLIMNGMYIKLLVTFCIVIIRCTETFWSPYIIVYKKFSSCSKQRKQLLGYRDLAASVSRDIIVARCEKTRETCKWNLWSRRKVSESRNTWPMLLTLGVHQSRLLGSPGLPQVGWPNPIFSSDLMHVAPPPPYIQKCVSSLKQSRKRQITMRFTGHDRIVGHQWGTCFMSHFWCLEFWGGVYIFRKYCVDPCLPLCLI